jgi:ADP-ribose pyrophosphatase
MNKLPMPSTHIIRETSKYSGHLKVSEIELKHALFKGGWSRPIKREIVQRENAIAVLPYDAIKDSVVLIRQFRIGSWANKDHPFLWETVAGLIEKGETPEDVANRECAEEAGCTPVKLIKISSYYSSPGMLSEYIDFFAESWTPQMRAGFTDLIKRMRI